MLRLVATVAVFLTLVFATIAFSGTSSPSVPGEAIALANNVLEERWRPAARENPDFYDLGDLDPAHARIGEPFRELELRGHNLDAFLDASVNDPTGFAGVEKYCLPLLIDGQDAGAIIVARNRDENGAKFLPEDGDFVLFGYYLPGDARVARVRELKATFPENSEIAWVRFVDAHVLPQIVVKLPDGQAYAGVSAEGLYPIAIAGPSIRSAIRAARERERNRLPED